MDDHSQNILISDIHEEASASIKGVKYFDTGTRFLFEQVIE